MHFRRFTIGYEAALVAALLLFGSALTSIAHADATLAPSAVSGYATFHAPETGNVSVVGIMGDNARPYEIPVKHLTMILVSASNASAFRNLQNNHTLIRKATIDDASDGQSYSLGNVRVIDVKGTDQQNSALSITVAVGIFHMTCGPPTCEHNVAD